MGNIRLRVLIIVGLVLASLYSLWPRDVTMRTRDAAGEYRDTTVRRVPIKYGLDLRGGMHVALEVDESRGVVNDRGEALERALRVIRNRIDQFGVSEPLVQQVGSDRIIVELPDVDDPARVQSIIDQNAYLQFQITDKTNALERAMPRIDQIVRTRGGEVAVAGAQPAAPAQPPGVAQLFTPGDTTAADTAAVDTTGLLTGPRVGAFSSLLQPGGMPGEYFVSAENLPTVQRYLSMPEVVAAIPPGKVIRLGTAETQQAQRGAVMTPVYVLDARPIITGEFLIDARPQQDPMEGTVVTFQLNNEGGRRFFNETTRHVNDYMAIVLDDRVMGRPPVIQSPIRTRGQITLRGRSLQEAQDLALVLRAGALPVPLQIVEMRRIGPSMGQDAINGGIRAFGFGLLLIVGFMLAYYRTAGALALGALVLYGLFTLATLAGFDAVLTLPGIAGFILSIGMAVDANVLIFERIREELDKGRTVRLAVEDGFKHALSAIVDSNVTTALTAMILYQFGTGPVQGFAVTLLAGIAASMVSAIFVTRTFFMIYMARKRGLQTLSI